MNPKPLVCKPLLNLACRCHIHELIIAKVFETVIERASGCPQIKLFQRFATAWNTISTHVFESAIMKIRPSIRAVSGEPVSSSGLEEAL